MVRCGEDLSRCLTLRSSMMMFEGEGVWGEAASSCARCVMHGRED